MTQLARELFPTALDFDNVCYWSGLRPTTPSNVPLIGRTKIQNLYLNTGHGTLGWTMGVVSGRALADLISGRRPEPDFPFLGQISYEITSALRRSVFGARVVVGGGWRIAAEVGSA